MKKLLSTLMATTIVASSASSVIACGSSRFQEIWLITDAGRIGDKSFNESAFNGGNQFLNDILGNEDGYSSIAYTEPRNLSGLEQAYQNAARRGAKTLILPGFHHAVDGEHRGAEIMKDSGGSTILLDSSYAGHNNQIGVLFRGDISGFFGGLSAIAYKVNGRVTAGSQAPVVLSTFGGSSNATAVDNFMVGYLAAVEFWNELSATDQAEIANIEAASYTQEIKAEIHNASDLSRTHTEAGSSYEGIQTSNRNWFTGTFADGDGLAISREFVGAGVDVIMPVAGPQTFDALSAIRENTSSTTKVVGVDTDQVLAYENHQDLFITSAQKDLVSTTVIALGHVNQYRENETVQNKVKDFWTESGLILTDSDNNTLVPEDEKGNSWEGRDIYAGGSMGTNEKNLIVSSGIYEGSLKDYLANDILQNALVKASIELFEAAGELNPALQSTILNMTNISAYAQTLIAALDNTDTNE